MKKLNAAGGVKVAMARGKGSWEASNQQTVQHADIGQESKRTEAPDKEAASKGRSRQTMTCDGDAAKSSCTLAVCATWPDCCHAGAATKQR